MPVNLWFDFVQWVRHDWSDTYQIWCNDSHDYHCRAWVTYSFWSICALRLVEHALGQLTDASICILKKEMRSRNYSQPKCRLPESKYPESWNPLAVLCTYAVKQELWAEQGGCLSAVAGLTNHELNSRPGSSSTTSAALHTICRQHKNFDGHGNNTLPCHHCRTCTCNANKRNLRARDLPQRWAFLAKKMPQCWVTSCTN